MTTITLGGRDFKLARPKGRAGRTLILAVQSAVATTSGALNVLESSEGDLGTGEISVILSACNKLFQDSELKFEDVIMPAMVMQAQDGFGDHDEAMSFLDSIEDSPLAIFVEFAKAAGFWMAMTPEEQAQLEEAQKKSRAVKKAARTKAEE